MIFYLKCAAYKSTYLLTYLLTVPSERLFSSTGFSLHQTIIKLWSTPTAAIVCCQSVQRCCYSWSTTWTFKQLQYDNAELTLTLWFSPTSNSYEWYLVFMLLFLLFSWYWWVQVHWYVIIIQYWIDSEPQNCINWSALDQTNPLFPGSFEHYFELH